MAKELVAYFSASGTTAKLAEKLASAIGAVQYHLYCISNLVVCCTNNHQYIFRAV